jgi:hypothetical protein
LISVLVVENPPRRRKSMIRHQDSHVDHGLSDDQIRYLLDRFADRKAFFLETLELPGALGAVSCALWGPAMGDPAIAEEEVVYAPRGTRRWASRLVERQARPTCLVTVIAGPHEGHPCVLYTAFGGPPAPQEPDDPGCKDPGTSAAFWRGHALAK